MINVRYLRMYAKRANKMKYHKSEWVQYLAKRIWAYNNISPIRDKFIKCLGGE